MLVVLRGERHTGTNFMKAVLSRNLSPLHELPLPYEHTWVTPTADRQTEPRSAQQYSQPPPYDGRLNASDLEPLMCCWKHGYASDACLPSPSIGPAPPTLFVLLVRSPYVWLPSMWLCPYEGGPGGKGSFSSWLSRPFPQVFPRQAHERSCLSTHSASSPLPAELFWLPSATAPRRPAHSSAVALWAAKAASYLAVKSPKVVITDEVLYDEQQLRQVLGAALRGAGLALRAGRLTLPLVTQLPPSLSAFDAKWRGIFTSAGYAAEGARITRREWMRFYTEADLDRVNVELGRTGAVGLMRGVRLQTVSALRLTPLYCGAAANCTARSFGGCTPLCAARRGAGGREEGRVPGERPAARARRRRRRLSRAQVSVGSAAHRW